MFWKRCEDVPFPVVIMYSLRDVREMNAYRPGRVRLHALFVYRTAGRILLKFATEIAIEGTSNSYFYSQQYQHNGRRNL
jgi:hypothetical protein